MIRIRYLNISFEEKIEPWEIGYFRGAVIQLAGRDNVLFHNHKGDSYRYKYPLIQYKRIDKKPHIICINEGIDEIHAFFEKKQDGILLNKRPYNLIVENLSLKYFTLQSWDTSFKYYLQDWMPISSKNATTFKLLKNEEEQKEFFKSIIIGNILSMAKGIKWEIDNQIQAEVNTIKSIRKIRHKELR